MVDILHLYISAAADLVQERESLSRAVAEIPVTLAWRVIQSPLHGELLNESAIAQADVHLLLLGWDIRAPIGYEWRLARRAHHQPAAFLKKAVVRTMAALDFIRYIGNQTEWRMYQDIHDLHRQTQKYLADHILSKPDYYALRPAEYEKLTSWRKTLDIPGQEPSEYLGGIGESSVLISPERYIPSEGVLIHAPPKGEKNQRSSK